MYHAIYYWLNVSRNVLLVKRITQLITGSAYHAIYYWLNVLLQ
jgi:hypothetical protein